MTFPIDDLYWLQVRDFLQQHAQPLDAILAPGEFFEPFPGTYPYSVSPALSLEQFAFAVIHKGQIAEIYAPLGAEIVHKFHPVYANAVFVVYARSPITEFLATDENDLKALFERMDAIDRFYDLEGNIQPAAAVVLTHNRPDALDRSLPQVLALNIPVVVVDNGSEGEKAAQNQALADRHQVQLLKLPQFRPAAALSAGVSYWLNDPSIRWISCFQDTAEVRPETIALLQKVQDPQERPLLVGDDDPDHATVRSDSVNGIPVKLKLSSSGVHFHAHRDYWASLLPIPVSTPPGDEEETLTATDENGWITTWSPRSIVKRGGYVVCVPGLVNASESTTLTVQPRSQPKSQPKIQPIAASHTDDSNSLAGVRVLIDGYNLQLTKGTGIKTYGLSLIQALTELGAEIDVLLSRSAYKKNAVLDEVYFFDNQDKDRNLLFVLKGLLKSLSGPLYRARRRDTSSNLVVKRGQYSDDFLKYAASFNLPQCYDLANVLYKKLKISTQITVPEKIDIWHATYPLPIQVRGAKKITTIHDLIPLRLPYATLDDKESFYYKTEAALKESAAIIAVSEHTKQDILTYFEVDPDRIIVTYQPIALKPLDDGDTDEEVEFFLQQYGLEPQNYLLFVGAIEPKKNVGRLLDAYATLDTEMPLIIAGKKGWLWEEELGKTAYLFDQKRSKKQVRLLEYVSTNALRYLYRGAYCFVFPSLYEGFGLPPVEAMTFGCPVITSNASCLPEVCGNAALYVDPYDVKDIRRKLEQVLSDRPLRDRLAKAGQQNSRNFSMEKYVQRLHQAYRTALG
ncbi:glycosyltransferase [Leptolyngbya sp. FACHB-711]|uniref:glycosyltransferase n=1 Tax=Leptolyngbya sp. FACHB-711 TaxID=2692813 RepID=UPI001682C06C|nr:glycosyltransferase [Leptolyngbya sp. FACHB-711]MBD2024947.1 glycosyltransferase [Leptolyngbya sp. FACHB-711]